MMKENEEIQGNDKREDMLNEQEKSSTPEANEVKVDSAKDKKKKKKSKEQPEVVAQMQAKIDDLNDKYLRLYSEFDNYRKRTLKERSELSKTASEEIIQSLLPVMDDLERGFKLTIQTPDKMEVLPLEGVQLVYQKFKNILATKGLEPIAAIGEPFNVDFHDALTNIPAPEEQKGKVVDEIERGYTLNGKVIRYAKVVVGN